MEVRSFAEDVFTPTRLRNRIMNSPILFPRGPKPDDWQVCTSQCSGADSLALPLQVPRLLNKIVLISTKEIVRNSSEQWSLYPPEVLR
jgi:hypothetical protein